MILPNGQRKSRSTITQVDCPRLALLTYSNVSGAVISVHDVLMMNLSSSIFTVMLVDLTSIQEENNPCYAWGVDLVIDMCRWMLNLSKPHSHQGHTSFQYVAETLSR